LVGIVVEQLQQASQQIIVVRPNQSASWELNLRVLIALGSWSLLIAVGFSWFGAWLILPFAGLEIAALFAALYFVCRKLSLRQVIGIDEHTVTIEKGFYYPIRRWQFAREHTRLVVQEKPHPWDAIGLSLFAPGSDDVLEVEVVEVGEFLNADDAQKLLDLLRSFSIAVRDRSLHGAQPF